MDKTATFFKDIVMQNKNFNVRLDTLYNKAGKSQVFFCVDSVFFALHANYTQSQKELSAGRNADTPAKPGALWAAAAGLLQRRSLCGIA
jgi:hypothetical protein